MKTFLLLVLSLMTGCEVSSEDAEVKACEGGWVEFTCNYPDPNKRYERIDLVYRDETTVQSTQTNVWETKNNIHLYHDTENKALRVSITQLQKKSFGEYECKFYLRANPPRKKTEQDVKLKQEEHGCQTQFTQTAYESAPTTITCDDSGNKRSGVQFFCKENGFLCEDILSIGSSLKSNGTFSLTETSSGFSVSISEVSSHHAAVYWCGVKPEPGSYRAALRKIQLEVENITTFSRSPAVGQNFTYWCRYDIQSNNKDPPVKKIICKGEDPSTCQRIISTSKNKKNSKENLDSHSKFSIKDDRENRNITITVRGVTADDTGTYWCGAESSDGRRSNKFFNRLLMTVVNQTTNTPSIISTTSPDPTPTSTTAKTDGGSWLTYRRLLAVIVAAVCVAVLVLVLVLVFIYKRFKHSKNKGNGEALNNKEERPYEEIKPDSGTALKSVYVTANFPTNPSALQHNVSNVSGETHFTAAGNDHTYSTVNHPPRLPGDSFYSTVCSPQS